MAQPQVKEALDTFGMEAAPGLAQFPDVLGNVLLERGDMEGAKQAFAKAVGDKSGVRRYGHAYVPLDEALSRVVLDLSGRPGLEFHCKFVRGVVGNFDLDLIHEFFQGFVNHAMVTLHVDNLRGENAHHQCETIFKAFGRALRMAVSLDDRSSGRIPSTKEVL